MIERPGAVSVAELILALLFFALIIRGGGAFLVGTTRLAGVQRDQVRMMALARTARIVVRGELRTLAPGDVSAMASDSLRIRAFRGGGRVCGGTGMEVWVRYRGTRVPDPEKDSLVLIDGSGGEQALAVTGVSAATCPDGVALRISEVPAVAPVYALLFESGAYHLSNGALRYRRGQGGRQPLTESLLEDAAFHSSGPLTHRIELRPRSDSLRSAEVRPRRLDVVGLNAVRP